MIGAFLRSSFFQQTAPVDYKFRHVTAANRVALDSGQAARGSFRLQILSTLSRQELQVSGGCRSAVSFVCIDLLYKRDQTTRMTNNDILRRIRYILNFDDAKMIETFAMADTRVRRGHIVSWLHKEDEPSYQECNDKMLATFLNGLISMRRGKKEGLQPEPESSLTNNLILKKLKIAFNLQSEDILAILALSDFDLSAPELSSFFRKPGHRNYRVCKDQVLRNFLMGLQIKLREKEKRHPGSIWPSHS